jgi:hypothetical protein
VRILQINKNHPALFPSMVLNQTILLSVIISAMFSGILSLSQDSANADISSCYDQIGDGHYCFEKKEKCEIANKDDSIAESPCYNEGYSDKELINTKDFHS